MANPTFFLEHILAPQDRGRNMQTEHVFHAGAPQRVMFSLTKFQTLQTCHQIERHRL